MVVLSLTNCPPALRGDITKWLLEIDVGVYVGNVSARVREQLWEKIVQNVRNGRAIMAYNAKTEQRLAFRVHNTDWRPIDFDGLTLMLRPGAQWPGALAPEEAGGSDAARMLAAKKFAKTASNRRFLLNDYAVIDIKTSGSNVEEDLILVLSAIKVRDNAVADKYLQLVRQDVRISEQIQALTGITAEMLRDEGVAEPKALDTFLEFIASQTVVSHNIHFDLAFIRAACERCGRGPFTNKGIDTLDLSRKILKDTSDFKLETLAQYFNIQVERRHCGQAPCGLADIETAGVGLADIETAGVGLAGSRLADSLTVKEIYDKLKEILEAAQ